jgi:hypothetical protein
LPQTRKGRDIEARELYFELGRNRSIAAVYLKLRERRGNVGVPALSTLEKWSAEQGWVEAARQWDEEQAERARKEWEDVAAAERYKRRQERAVFARARRQMVMQAFTVPGTNRPINLHDLEPRMITALGRLVYQADEEERLDMGDATERTEASGTPGGDPIPVSGTVEHIHVLGPEALAEARLQLVTLVEHLRRDSEDEDTATPFPFSLPVIDMEE